LAPPLPVIPENRVGEPFLTMISCWTGDHYGGAKVLESFRDVAQPVAELVVPMPYRQLNALFDDLVPSGLQHYWKAVFTGDLTDRRSLPTPSRGCVCRCSIPRWTFSR
jgi:hypothetical protein